MNSGLGSNVVGPATTKDSMYGGCYYRDGEENTGGGGGGSSGLVEVYGAGRGLGLKKNHDPLQELYDS